MNPGYVDTVRLLLAIAPAVFASGRFAMKGGTALNLFVQEMPRLSVDIDLVFVDHRPDRPAALQTIALQLAQVQAALAGKGYRAHLPASAAGDDVKLVAAMDRQHPRDIFDVMHMLDHVGWQASVVDCFVAYLAGHNRPVHEVLFPRVKPLEPAFTNEFAGMTRDVIELDTLARVQARLLEELPRQLTAAHRDFLLTLVQGRPAWERMPIQHLHELPAIKWKLTNLAQLEKRSAARFAAQHELLAEHFAERQPRARK